MNFKELFFKIKKSKVAMPLALVVILIIVVYLLTMPPGYTWEHYGYDAGDLIACVYTWGVPHPPGTPLYVLLGQVFRYLPFFGVPASKFNFMSAFFGWLTVGLVYLTAKRLVKKEFPAILAVLFFAFAPLIWGQSIITEVLTLNLFLMALSTYFLVRWEQEIGKSDIANKFLYLGIFSFGLALTNHTSSLMLAPAILFLVLSVQPSRVTRPKNFFKLAVAFGLGLLPYLYLPIRAAMKPPLNWGDPSSLSRFISHVTAEEYQQFLFVAPSLFLDNLLRFLEAVWVNFNTVGTLLIVLGLVFGRKNRLRDFLVFSILFQLLFVFNYNIVNIETYLLPVFFNLALFLGVGCVVIRGLFETAADWVARRDLRPFARLESWRSSEAYEISFSSFVLFLLNLLLLIFSVLNVPLKWEEVDLSDDHTAYNFGRTVFETVEPGSIVLAEGDKYFYNLTYSKYVLYPETDIAVLHIAFFHKMDWVVEQAMQNYSHLKFPRTSATMSQEEAEQALMDFVNMNIDDRAVYLAVKESPVGEGRVSRSVWGDRFVVQSEGPIYKVLGRKGQESEL